MINLLTNTSPSNLVINPSAPANKQSVLIHTGPNPTNAGIVNTLKNIGIRSIFLTDFENAVAYQNIPSDYINFLNLVAA
jgi:hypothetical protein